MNAAIKASMPRTIPAIAPLLRFPLEPDFGQAVVTIVCVVTAPSLVMVCMLVMIVGVPLEVLVVVSAS